MVKRKPQVTLNENEESAIESAIIVLKSLETRDDSIVLYNNFLINTLSNLLDRSKRKDDK